MILELLVNIIRLLAHLASAGDARTHPEDSLVVTLHLVVVLSRVHVRILRLIKLDLV